MYLSRRKLLLIGGLVTFSQFVVAVTPSNLRAQVPAHPELVQEFVGEVPDTPFYVAIAMEPDPASSSHRVTAYVCDGQDVSHLLRGQAADTRFDLVTEDGSAQLTGAIVPAGVVGTFSAHGADSAFSAIPTRAFGGLYRTTAQDELRAVGMSLAGAEVRMEMTPDQTRLLSTVVRPDGRMFRYDVPLPERMRTPTEYQESWLIMLNDGRSRGGRIASSRKPGGRFTNVPAG